MMMYFDSHILLTRKAAVKPKGGTRMDPKRERNINELAKKIFELEDEDSAKAISAGIQKLLDAVALDAAQTSQFFRKTRATLLKEKMKFRREISCREKIRKNLALPISKEDKRKIMRYVQRAYDLSHPHHDFIFRLLEAEDEVKTAKRRCKKNWICNHCGKVMEVGHTRAVILVRYHDHRGNGPDVRSHVLSFCNFEEAHQFVLGIDKMIAELDREIICCKRANSLKEYC